MIRLIILIIFFYTTTTFAQQTSSNSTTKGDSLESLLFDPEFKGSMKLFKPFSPELQDSVITYIDFEISNHQPTKTQFDHELNNLLLKKEFYTHILDGKFRYKKIEDSSFSPIEIQFAESALKSCQPNTVLLLNKYFHLLHYVQTKHKLRPDVVIVSIEHLAMAEYRRYIEKTYGLRSSFTIEECKKLLKAAKWGHSIAVEFEDIQTVDGTYKYRSHSMKTTGMQNQLDLLKSNPTTEFSILEFNIHSLFLDINARNYGIVRDLRANLSYKSEAKKEHQKAAAISFINSVDVSGPIDFSDPVQEEIFKHFITCSFPLLHEMAMERQVDEARELLHFIYDKVWSYEESKNHMRVYDISMAMRLAEFKIGCSLADKFLQAHPELKEPSNSKNQDLKKLLDMVTRYQSYSMREVLLKHGLPAPEVPALEPDYVYYEAFSPTMPLNEWREKAGFHFFKKDGKTGIVVNKWSYKATIEAEYDSLFHEYDDQFYFVAQKNGKWGVITYNSKIVVPFEYDDFRFEGSDMNRSLDQSIFNFKKGSGWGLVQVTAKEDTTRSVILPFEYDAIEYSYNTAFFLLQKNNLEGGFYHWFGSNCILEPKYKSVGKPNTNFTLEVYPVITQEGDTIRVDAHNNIVTE